MKAEDVHGVEFDWWGVDQDGHIALFCSAGYGAIPSIVLDNPGSADDVALLQLILREVAPCCGSRVEGRGPGSCKEWPQLAERGIFVFDWRAYQGPYERVMVPEIPLSTALLSTAVKDRVLLVNLSSILFTKATEVSSLELQAYGWVGQQAQREQPGTSLTKRPGT